MTPDDLKRFNGIKGMRERNFSLKGVKWPDKTVDFLISMVDAERKEVTRFEQMLFDLMDGGIPIRRVEIKGEINFIKLR